MHYRRVLGVSLAAAGIVGYAAGVYVAYPGCAFSLTTPTEEGSV